MLAFCSRIIDLHSFKINSFIVYVKVILNNLGTFYYEIIRRRSITLLAFGYAAHKFQSYSRLPQHVKTRDSDNQITDKVTFFFQVFFINTEAMLNLCSMNFVTVKVGWFSRF